MLFSSGSGGPMSDQRAISSVKKQNTIVAHAMQNSQRNFFWVLGFQPKPPPSCWICLYAKENISLIM